MFSVSFGFETRNKTISSLIYRLMNEALLVADHISNRCHFRSWHTLLVSDKHVPAFLFQSVSLGSGALVWFSCSQGWKYMVHRTITVMSCCSNSCCHTSVKLLVTYFPAHHACTKAPSFCDTRLWTSHQTCGVSIDQTSVLYCTGYGQSFRNAFIRNSKFRYTSLISCGY